ncbi:MAG: zinc-binding dehydrogenase [Candidatus Solibacter usitatus]|nr:zinc-binding dehydrogenase [Candidatus Solibacter usitatus]
MKQQMMAAVLYGRESLQIEPVAVPQVGPEDVLVRVRAALTCGTDVKVFQRGYHARMIVPPALFGHELAGDIVSVGENVRKFHVGQRVVSANSAPCGACFYCARNKENLCEDLLFNNGAYAEYIRIPGRIVQKNLYEIPAHISYQDAALIEPLACVMRGLEECGLEGVETIAVIGLGPIGLMFVRLARVFGCRVIAIGRRKSQLDKAAKMGATDLLCTADSYDHAARVRELTGKRGVDIAIEAVGTPETWQLAARMVRKGGTVNFFGGCPNDSAVALDTSLLHYSEITCKATFHHTPAYIRKALDTVSRLDITARDLVNREEPLTNLLEVLRHLMSHNGHMKTAIIP